MNSLICSCGNPSCMDSEIWKSSRIFEKVRDLMFDAKRNCKMICKVSVRGGIFSMPLEAELSLLLFFFICLLEL